MYDEVFDLLYKYDFERKDITVDMLRDEIVDFEEGDLLLADPKSLEVDDRILDLYRISNKRTPFVIAAPKYPQSVTLEMLRSWNLPEADHINNNNRKRVNNSRLEANETDDAESGSFDHGTFDEDDLIGMTFDGVDVADGIRQTPVEEAAEVIQQLSKIILSLVQGRYADATSGSELCLDLIRTAEKLRGIRRPDRRTALNNSDEKNMLRGDCREHDDNAA